MTDTHPSPTDISEEMVEAYARARYGEDWRFWPENERNAREQLAAAALILRAQDAARIAELGQALAFAASVIKSGEPWTATCEQVIGEALRSSRKDRP